MSNRSQRRRMERVFNKVQPVKDMPIKERREEASSVRKRKREAGKQIHHQHLQNVENSLREQRENREAKTVQGLVEIGFSVDAAMDLVAKNNGIETDYDDSLNKRYLRQRKINIMI